LTSRCEASIRSLKQGDSRVFAFVTTTQVFFTSNRTLGSNQSAVEKNGSKFVLVTLTNAEQVHPEQGEEEFSKQYGLKFDYDQPSRILGELAKQEVITSLQWMPSFRKYHAETGQYLHGFGSRTVGHWNKCGHRLVTKEIVKFLVEKRLIPMDSCSATNAGT